MLLEIPALIETVITNILDYLYTWLILSSGNIEHHIWMCKFNIAATVDCVIMFDQNQLPNRTIIRLVSLKNSQIFLECEILIRILFKLDIKLIGEMLRVMPMQKIKLTRSPFTSFYMHLILMKSHHTCRNCMDNFTHIRKSLNFYNHPDMPKIRLIRLSHNNLLWLDFVGKGFQINRQTCCFIDDHVIVSFSEFYHLIVHGWYWNIEIIMDICIW